MLLLLPILVPLIGGIFVFRQKNETYRDWLVVTLIVITAVMVLANCTMPTQRLWLLTIQGDLGLVLNSDWLSKFFMVLAVCIWAPVVTEGFFPGRDFITERREVGVQMTWPMIAFAAAVVLMGLLPGGLLHWLGLLAARLFP